MLSKPPIVAAIITALAAIPLTILSNQSFQLTLNNLPLFLIAVLVISLVSAFWASPTSTKTAADRPRSIAKSANNLPREKGKVKWFNASKGFGFITRDSGDDIFVHFRSIQGSGHRVLRDGQRVEFAVSEGSKGLQAEDVAVAGQ